jgi:hypothetical protein
MSRAFQMAVWKAFRTVVHLVGPKALTSAVLKGDQKGAKMAGSTASSKADSWVAPTAST